MKKSRARPSRSSACKSLITDPFIPGRVRPATNNFTSGGNDVIAPITVSKPFVGLIMPKNRIVNSFFRPTLNDSFR